MKGIMSEILEATATGGSDSSSTAVYLGHVQHLALIEALARGEDDHVSKVDDACFFDGIEIIPVEKDNYLRVI